MVTAVTKFHTSDKKEFTSELEANGHEKSLVMHPAINAFALALGLGPAEATRARKYVSGFSAFMETYVPEVAANDGEAQAAA